MTVWALIQALAQMDPTLPVEMGGRAIIGLYALTITGAPPCVVLEDDGYLPSESERQRLAAETAAWEQEREGYLLRRPGGAFWVDRFRRMRADRAVEEAKRQREAFASFVEWARQASGAGEDHRPGNHERQRLATWAAEESEVTKVARALLSE